MKSSLWVFVPTLEFSGRRFQHIKRVKITFQISLGFQGFWRVGLHRTSWMEPFYIVVFLIFLFAPSTSVVWRMEWFLGWTVPLRWTGKASSCCTDLHCALLDGSWSVPHTDFFFGLHLVAFQPPQHSHSLWSHHRVSREQPSRPFHWWLL